VNPTSILAGGTNISNGLAVGLNKGIFEAFSFFSEKGLAVSAIEKEVKVIFPPKLNFLSILRFLRNFIRKNKIDIIHLHGTRAAFWGRLAVIGLKNKPKVIYTLHGFHIIRKRFFLKQPLILLEKFLNHWTDILVCVSEADKKLVLKYKTILPSKIKIIKNGINVNTFQANQNLIKKAKKELKLENNFVLAVIGRLHPQKDFSTILEALKIISSKISKIKLLIIGDGPLRKQLEREVKHLELDKYVEFLGFRKDIPVLINLSDIVILSTKWEGLPLVPLEAEACKKPIIASDVDGVREVIIDKETGYLFKPYSEEDLADKILELYYSKELRQQIGKKGYQFVLKNFSEQKMVQEYQSLYLSLL